MWGYVVSSLAWSAIGFAIGAQVGWDIRTITGHSGRQKHDDT